MDTACLRIKFTSLLKKLRSDDSKSKCCLNIVPEVACLQNFDKIQWKRDHNLYEYVIPMTYKIILKKCKEHNEYKNCKQVYHSCVDLLHTSATSSIDEAGNINRTFSETLLLNRAPAEIHECSSMIISEHKEINFNPGDKVAIDACTKKDELTPAEFKNSNNNEDKDNCAISIDSESKDCVTPINDIQDSFGNIMNVMKECFEMGLKRRTNQNSFRVAKNNLIEESVNPTPVKSRDDTKCKLSLTPICSINTEDTFNMSSYENCHNTYSIAIYDNNGYYKDILSYDNLPINNLKNYAPDKYFDHFKRLETNHDTPEVRIEKILKLIEYEILPLKCMLNNIIKKYTSLNIDDKILKSWLHTSKNKQLKKCKSNRVSYTVVFDG